MEQNYQQEPKVKEKSIYLLHLDGPRILILSAIVIGLLSVAFLVGMKLMGDDKTEPVTAQNDSILEQPETLPATDTLDPLKAPIPDLQPDQNQQAQQQALLPPQDSVVPQSSTYTQQSTKKSDSDSLTQGTQHVIPASKKLSSNESAKKNKSQKSSKQASKSKKSKSTDKSDKKSIVEVSDSKTKTDKKIMHGFFVQLASFDKLEKAKTEVVKLKDLSYDAHYDKKEIKGKDFFRVRIGPIASKEKALDMLDEIQENPKYEESFIIHE